MGWGRTSPSVRVRFPRVRLFSGGCARSAYWQLAVVVMWASACTETLPSEEWMREHFTKHRPELETLVRMSNEDFKLRQVTRITASYVWTSDNWLWPRPEAEWGLSRARWEQYKALFTRLKLPRGLDRAGPANDAILLAVRGEGVAGGGAEYGYLWAEKRPMSVDAKGQSFMAKPLKDAKDKWYLYRWKVDKAELKKNESRRFSPDAGK